jgi:hypothetical protein
VKIYYCNFACSFIWALNLVSDITGRTYTERVSEEGAEENMWTEGG